jgi:hypothetical protein
VLLIQYRPNKASETAWKASAFRSHPQMIRRRSADHSRTDDPQRMIEMAPSDDDPQIRRSADLRMSLMRNPRFLIQFQRPLNKDMFSSYFSFL